MSTKMNRVWASLPYTQHVKMSLLGALERDKELLAELTASQLCHVARLLHIHWHEAQVAKEHSIVQEGWVYDSRNNKVLVLEEEKQ